MLSPPRLFFRQLVQLPTRREDIPRPHSKLNLFEFGAPAGTKIDNNNERP